jgi:hypothetical protein
MPEKVELDDDLKAALDRIPSVYQSVVPKGRVVLSATALTKLADEKKAIDAVLKILGERKDAIAAAVSTHFDKQAEVDGKANEKTLRDANGHYLYANGDEREEAPLKGGELQWTRETSKTSTGMSGARLEVGYRTGEIPESVFVRLTKTVRVFDDKLVAAALAEPMTPKERKELVDVISKITTRTVGRGSVNLRPVPKTKATRRAK